MLKSNKGITLITLSITIIIMMILSFTVSVNTSMYIERKKTTNFDSDIMKLQEEISHYYVENKELPIANKYTNVDMLEKDINDNENYYVIDLAEFEDLELSYGQDYYEITDYTLEISDLEDIYIVNEQSHAIYYPKGIEYDGIRYYTINSESGTQIEDISLTGIEIVGEVTTQVGQTIQLTVNAIPSFFTDVEVEWISSDETILTVDENGRITAKGVGTATVTARTKDNTEITDTHEIIVELNTARYILLEVYGRFGSNAAIISELEIYDENNNEMQYTVVVEEAYDSVTAALPKHWENESYWNYTNLYDGETAYTSNKVGNQNCTAFILDGSTDAYARFMVDLGEEKTISDIKVYVGDNDTTFSDGAGGRTPLSISAYKVNNYFAHEENNTFSTYYNNIAQRNNEGLKLLGTIEFEARVTTTTGYSLIK